MKLLYVLDDDILEPIMWRAACEETPYTVLGFPTPLSFRQAVMEREPEIAIIDLIMPNEGGDEVCKWVKVCYPAIDLYVCTNDDRAEVRVMVESCGAKFISKQLKHSERLEVISGNRN